LQHDSSAAIAEQSMNGEMSSTPITTAVFATPVRIIAVAAVRL
jgi:hypothetical protein